MASFQEIASWVLRHTGDVEALLGLFADGVQLADAYAAFPIVLRIVQDFPLTVATTLDAHELGNAFVDPEFQALLQAQSFEDGVASSRVENLLKLLAQYGPALAKIILVFAK